jgi:hypothetical protein
MKQHSEQIELRNQAYYAFAERLLTLSTGALALSIAFRHSFSASTPIHMCLLKTAWISFVVTILSSTAIQYSKVTFHRNLAAAMKEAENLGQGSEPPFYTPIHRWWLVSGNIPAHEPPREWSDKLLAFHDKLTFRLSLDLRSLRQQIKD